MSGRIAKTFLDLQSRGRKALIPYLSCGDPTLEFTESLALRLPEAGADLIELGIPYSDPVADGPTIQKASQRALAGGATLEKIFELAGGIRAKSRVPLVFMTYYNPIYRYGQERFIARAVRAGIDGFIVPDLPPEEAVTLKQITDSLETDLIFLAAPTSTTQRLEMIARLARGFVYCVSVTGVTGSRSDFAQDLESFISRVRAVTSFPLAVGFGISGPITAARAARAADGVIVGSSLIERIEDSLDLVADQPQQVVQEVCQYLKSLREAIDKTF